MSDLFRTTTIGTILRLVSRGKVLGWEENTNPELREKYVHGNDKPNEEKSGDEGSDTENPDDEKPAREDSGDQNSERTLATGEDKEGEGKEGDDKDAKRDAEKGPEEDYTLIDFLPNDPQNPQNWTIQKKCFVTFGICLLTFSVYIGSAIYTTGETTLEQDFGISSTVAIIGLTLYVLGYGLGPMIWAPMSEIPQIGRNPVYIGTLTVFVFFNFAVVYAKNLGMLLAFRFLTGFFGSPILATGAASLGDMFKPSKRAYPMAVFAVFNVMGPTVGPLIGGFAAEAKGWTWTIWELIWLSGFCLIWLIFTLPETSAKTILYRRTARLRKNAPPGAPTIKCQPELDAADMSAKDMAYMTFVQPFVMCFSEPIIFGLNLYIGLIYAVLYCWLESIPILFEEKHGFSLGITGLCYLGITVGCLICLPPYFYYGYYYVEPRFNDKQEIKPEIRLEAALVGCFCLPICLFWFGWTARADILWIVPVIATSFFSISAFCSFLSVLNYLGDAYPMYAAAVYAGNDLFRSAMGAGFPLFADQMFTKLGLDWGSSLLGFISLIFIPMIWFLWWKGESIRKMSKKARHDI